MNVSEICAEGIFVTFPWWLKNVKSRSKKALFSNERHFDLDFQKRRQLRFSEVNYLNYTKKTQFCMWQYYIFPKARGNKNKQCTHSTPLKGVLFNILIMTKTLKNSFYLFTQFYFTLFLASQTGHNVPLSLPQPGLDQKKYQFMALIPDPPPP